MKNLTDYISEAKLYGLSFDIKDIDSMDEETLRAAHQEIGDVLFKLQDRKMNTSTIKRYADKVETALKKFEK